MGQYMTTQSIADDMCNLIYASEKEWYVLDPACGDGNLLLAAARRMQEVGVDRIEKRIAGFDLDQSMVKKSRSRLAEALNCQEEELQIYQRDFLNGGHGTLFSSKLPKDFEANVILANPPYGENKEYAFFERTTEITKEGAELIFLMPIAFMDRSEGVKCLPIHGSPLGVTTGSCMTHYVSGSGYDFKRVKRAQSNSSPFEVLTGIKTYEKGAGVPPQTQEVVDSKPFTSEEQKEGWLPCVRTGDIEPFNVKTGRWWVDYGEHLAHPKNEERFQGPKIFLRRVPLWNPRRLAAAYTEQKILCAGDVLVIRHERDSPLLLRGLCSFINSQEAINNVFARRPSVKYRSSYPKVASKDINLLLEHNLPDNEVIKEIGKRGEKDKSRKVTAKKSYLIESDFPIEKVSDSSAREKSVRHGHISTFQFWWARRPLAACRAAIFTALCAGPELVEASADLEDELRQFASGEDAEELLLSFAGKLSEWSACDNEALLNTARKLVSAGRTSDPAVADTLAGGGSFPLEGLRLGADAVGSDLNPVASIALKAATEYLPSKSVRFLNLYEQVQKTVKQRLKEEVGTLYKTEDGDPLAYFWARTYKCPGCDVTVPLMKNKWLAKRRENIAVRLDKSGDHFDFEVYSPSSSEEESRANNGTIYRKRATCPNCGEKVDTKFLREKGKGGDLGERLYAKRTINENGSYSYTSCTVKDSQEAKRVSERSTIDKSFLENELDKNGIRHMWAMAYGVEEIGDLFNRRQKEALLRSLEVIQEVLGRKYVKENKIEDKKLMSILMALNINRVAMYSNRHSWWQSNGQFPANIFVRQSISMVWNYVETPVTSPKAGGWESASDWLGRVIDHLMNIKKSGNAYLEDAANTSHPDSSFDLVTLDPPYYDSITYGYLSDFFYVWTKKVTKEHFSDWFKSSLSPKDEEAVVDREHDDAPSPKGHEHFRKKMLQVFLEARRIMKPEGRVLLMFGHKSPQAWEAIITSLLKSGLVPSVSWPIHTERKSKFKHGKIDALSSSCLIVCESKKSVEKEKIYWSEFKSLLEAELEDRIRRFRKAHLYGSDLEASLIAPVTSKMHEYFVVDEDDSLVSPGEIITERLPKISRKSQLKVLLEDSRLDESGELESIIRHVANGDESGGTKNWMEVDLDHPAVGKAQQFVNLLQNGNADHADEIWREMGSSLRHATETFIQAVATGGTDNGAAKRAARAGLGRISGLRRETN